MMIQEEKRNKAAQELWVRFRDALEAYRGDRSYNEEIRGSGFEVKHMVFDSGSIFFSIVTSFPVLIPYTILAGGFESCMHFIRDEIECLQSGARR